MSNHRLSRRDVSILVANALDQFETALYGFLAPILAPIFFPDYDPIVQLIMAYGILALSFFTRPLGAIIFGMIARIYGPSFGLTYSILGVALTTAVVAFIPGFSEWGWLAPLGLMIIRTLKGVFAAGESTIARLMILDAKSTPHALKASYYYESSSMVGIIVASGIATLVIALKGIELPITLWRTCFLGGGLIGFLGYFLRHTQHEKTPDSENPHYPDFIHYPASSKQVFWQQKYNVLRVMLATSFSHLTYVVPFLLMNTFGPLITNISLETMMGLNTALLVFDMIMIPILGRLVMKFEPTRVMILSSLVLACSILPLFQGLYNASLLYVTFVRVWVVVWGLIFLCPLNLWFKRLFHNQPDQFLLVGVGDALGTAAVGHTSAPLCMWLWYVSGSAIAPALYITVIMLATVYAIQSATKTSQRHPIQSVFQALLYKLRLQFQLK